MAIHHVLGGGTLFHVRPHLALAAPAFGALARRIDELLRARGEETRLHLTRMADPASSLVDNADVGALLRDLVSDPSARSVFMTAALVDWEGSVDGAAGKDAPRLRSEEGPRAILLEPAAKLVGALRATRKDLFVVACKTTAGATLDEQFAAGLALLKRASVNLVLANDVHTRRSMIVTPEESRYYALPSDPAARGGGLDRDAAVRGLVDVALARMSNRFTRSDVVDGEPVSWTSPLVPTALREVVDHCIARGAYKPFLGATVGHFAARLPDGRILTSRRKSDFNRIAEVGLVLVVPQGDDRVTAVGGKPSVGGQSQRIIFREHPALDCIVHFHCPLRRGVSDVPVRSQWPYECGSHECGENTSRGLARLAGTPVHAVMLEQHGPNVVFSRAVRAAEVISAIEARFDLRARTDRPVIAQEAA